MKAKILNLTTLFVFITIAAAIYFVSAYISPFLHYHLQHIAFISGWEFFQNFTDYPGGTADYCALFISQFFYFKFPGSFLLVFIASIQALIALILVRRLTGSSNLEYLSFSLVLVFGVLSFLNYLYPYYITVRLLFAYIFILIFSILNDRFPKPKLLYWLLMAGLLFYFASGSALIVFTFSTILIFLKSEKYKLRWISVLVMIIFAGMLPFIGFKFIFQTSLENLYKISIDKPPAMLAYTPDLSVYFFYGILPIMLFAGYLFSIIPQKNIVPKASEKTSVKNRALTHARYYLSLQILVVIIFAYIIIKKEYNPFKKNLLIMDYYAENEQWREVLRTIKSFNEYDFRVNFQGARAIAHLGLLPERLFEYPQLLGTQGLFLNANLAKSASVITSDLFFELGSMSESQHWAFEAQTLLPHSPRIMKRIILINLINRNYILAEKFLNILDNNMLYHDWVRKYKPYINDTTLADKDPLISEKRLLSPQESVINVGVDDCLRLLLAKWPKNRMAYDYLLSYYLLDSNLIGFVDYLKQYKSFKLKTLPRYWEEGLLLYVAKTKSIPDDFPQEIITEKTLKEFTDFTKILKQNNNDMKAAKKELLSKYGDTYWYYTLYFDPKVTDVLSKKAEVK